MFANMYCRLRSKLFAVYIAFGCVKFLNRAKQILQRKYNKYDRPDQVQRINLILLRPESNKISINSAPGMNRTHPKGKES